MAKGKYSARAANRLVQSDNALLQSKIEECERLKTEVSAIKSELHALQRSRSAEITRRAEDLSRACIDAERSRSANTLADTRARYAESGRYIANKLWDYFVGTDGEGLLPRFFLSDVLPRLLGEDEVNELISSRLAGVPGCSVSRDGRRNGLKNFVRNSNIVDNSGHRSDLMKPMFAARYGSKQASEVVHSRTNPKAEADEQESFGATAIVERSSRITWPECELEAAS
ncbi:hypothetical protein PJN91_17170 [Mycobacterium kansasii]